MAVVFPKLEALSPESYAHSMTHPPAQSDAPPSRGKMLLRYGGFVVAVVLLGASIWLAIGEGRRPLPDDPDGRTGFQRVLDADWRRVVWLGVLSGLTGVVVPAMTLWLAHRPFVDPRRPIKPMAMVGLLAASALLNYTPVKAGFVGRLAYVKHRHGVTYRNSVLITALLMGAILGTVGIVMVATICRSELDAWWWATLVVGTPAVAALGTVITHDLLPKRIGDWLGRADLKHRGQTFIMLVGCIATQLVNLALLALRWHVVGLILSIQMSTRDALALAMLHAIMTMAPANGLGMRTVFSKLIGRYNLLSEAVRAQAAMIGILDRAVEAVVLIVLGLAGILWLRRADPAALHTDDMEREISRETND